MRKVILTGERPTGPLHIGHYVGSLRNRVKLQEEYETYILVADVQALTDNFNNPEKVRKNVKELVIDLIKKRLENITLIPEVSVRDSYSVSEVHRQITNNDTVEEQEEIADDKKYEEMTLDFEVAEQKKVYEKEEKEKLKEELPFEIEEEEGKK